MRSEIKPLYSLESEQGVVGALLINIEPVHDVMELVKTDDFLDVNNRIIFDVITHLVDSGEQVDAITVSEKAQARTGRNFLPLVVEMASNTSGTSNILAYAKIIRELSVKRKIIECADQVSDYVKNKQDASADDAVNFANTEFGKIEVDEGANTRSVSTGEALKAYIEDFDERFNRGNMINGLPSGWEDMDALINGWKDGNLIVIAGRPSMGKTTYGLQMAGHMAMSGKNGLFFSIEMSQNELTEKLISCFGQIPLDFLQSPQKNRDESMWSALEAGARKIKDMRLRVIECPGIHINQLKAYARKAHRKERLDFLFVDHIHIMSADGQNREREISQISGALKNLAGELNIPVFALAQLNRGVESRTDKQPRLSDLRDSGSVEQDANIIQLIYRDDYYNDDPNNPNKDLVQIDTAKNRNGKKGKITLGNRFDQSRLTNSDKRIVHDKPTGKSMFDDL